MGESNLDGFAVGGRVVLAHEPPFGLGPIRIEPPTRQVIAGSQPQTLEPRVMQVMVVLVQAGGRVVTRDEMVDRCWDGRIVGDDAIHRVISRLRHLAEDLGNAFRIETIPRVGYRLLVNGDPVPGSEGSPRRTDTAPASRRKILIGAGAVAIAGAVGAAALRQFPQREPDRLARLYYERGLAARGQASRAMSEQGVADLREAVRIDPDYAEAWAALAWGYRGLLEFGPHPDSARIQAAAKSAALRALQLQPDNMDARATILLIPPFYRHWTSIEAGCRELLARDANHRISLYNLAFVLMETGRWSESVPYLQSLKRIEPLWPLPRMRLSQALRTAGRIDETDDEIEALLKSWPRRFDIWSLKSRHLLMTGRSAEAVLFVEDASLQPPDTKALVEIDRAVVRAFASKSPADRQRAVALRLSDPRLRSVMVVWAVLDLSILGEVDTAFSLLEGYYFGRGKWASLRSDRPRTEMLFSIMAEPLRRDSRFQSLLVETGLQRFWEQAGVRPDSSSLT